MNGLAESVLELSMRKSLLRPVQAGPRRPNLLHPMLASLRGNWTRSDTHLWSLGHAARPRSIGQHRERGYHNNCETAVYQ